MQQEIFDSLVEKETKESTDKFWKSISLPLRAAIKVSVETVKKIEVGDDAEFDGDDWECWLADYICEEVDEG